MKKLYAALMIAFACGCSQYDDAQTSNTDTEVITFSVAEQSENSATTKGTPVLDSTLMGSIGVYCANTYDVGWSEQASFDKMFNQRLDYIDATSGWKYFNDNIAMWDENRDTDIYTFFAYSPFETSSNGITTRIEQGELVVSYQMPSVCTQQPDLMLSTPRRNINAPMSGVVSLAFTHTLSALGFSVVGDGTEVIKSISLNGIISSADVSVDDSGAVQWEYTTSRDDIYYEAEINSNVSPDAQSSSQLTLDNGYLMVIPQSIEGVELIVECYNTLSEECTERLYSFAQGSSWVAGVIYEYTINLDSYDYTIEGTSNCYMLHPNGKQQTFYIPVEGRVNTFWRDYADDNETYADMLSSSDEWTAVVLWHDIEGGLGDFSAQRVVSGFTPSEDVTPQSSPDFTTIGTRSAMMITLPATISEGNVSIGVEYQGQILWSWHLWITEYNPDEIAQQVSANRNKYVYNTGGVEGELHRYDNDDLWGSGGIYQDKFIMDRNIGSFDSGYSSSGRGVLHYQFGRKDPFPAATLSLGEVVVNDDNNQVSFMEAVQNPTTFYVMTQRPFSWSIEGLEYASSYLWDDKKIAYTTSNAESEKSIFDPSPLGWKLPIYGTFSALNNNNCKTSSSSNVMTYNSDILFPLTGFRSNARGSVSSYGTEGYLRLATPVDNSSARNLAYSTSVSDASNTRADGFSVRAIQE